MNPPTTEVGREMPSPFAAAKVTEVVPAPAEEAAVTVTVTCWKVLSTAALTGLKDKVSCVCAVANAVNSVTRSPTNCKVVALAQPEIV
ncbi:hypothetical protein D3C75_821700 [compost metagenome]